MRHRHAPDTEFLALNAMTGAAGGAAAAGGGMYLYCKSKCPGGTGIGKMFGGMKDYLLGAEDKGDGEPLEGDELDIKRITAVRRRSCQANCKIDALLAAAAGAAAGGAAGAYAKQKGMMQGQSPGMGAPGMGAPG